MMSTWTGTSALCLVPAEPSASFSTGTREPPDKDAYILISHVEEVYGDLIVNLFGPDGVGLDRAMKRMLAFGNVREWKPSPQRRGLHMGDVTNLLLGRARQKAADNTVAPLSLEELQRLDSLWREKERREKSRRQPGK